MPQCWICEASATSREHKIKRTDLERVHGRGHEFSSAKLSYLKSDGEVVRLQGAKANCVKYDPGLCNECNNLRSQPYDRTYDRFAKYIDENTTTLVGRRQINFSDIYGDAWRVEQVSLFKYFVKAFGCRIADSGQSVPSGLREILFDQYPEFPVAICFAVDEDEMSKPICDQKRLAIGNLINCTGEGSHVRFSTSSRYRWLLITYWYNWGPYGPVGEPWSTQQQFICCGSYRASEANVSIARMDGSLMNWPGIES
jgi:hypothetical protein